MKRAGSLTGSTISPLRRYVDTVILCTDTVRAHTNGIPSIAGLDLSRSLLTYRAFKLIDIGVYAPDTHVEISDLPAGDLSPCVIIRHHRTSRYYRC